MEFHQIYDPIVNQWWLAGFSEYLNDKESLALIKAIEELSILSKVTKQCVHMRKVCLVDVYHFFGFMFASGAAHIRKYCFRFYKYLLEGDEKSTCGKTQNISLIRKNYCTCSQVVVLRIFPIGGRPAGVYKHNKGFCLSLKIINKNNSKSIFLLEFYQIFLFYQTCLCQLKKTLADFKAPLNIYRGLFTSNNLFTLFTRVSTEMNILISFS